MTKSELIHRIAQKQSQIVERDVELAVKMMLDQMAACLAGGGRIEIRGFGSFSLHFRRARVGRNPKTGTPVSLPVRHAPYFKPGKKLRERVDHEYRGPSEAQRHAGGFRGCAGALRPVTCASNARTRLGQVTSATSRWPRGSCTWWRPWTGILAGCCHGGCRTPWIRTSVSKPWRKLYSALKRRRSSIPTKGVPVHL